MTTPMTPMRTLWYMGAKTRLCEEFIDGAVRDLVSPGATILDACAGTAAVGRWFAGDYRIFANDAQMFSSEIARAHLEVTHEWSQELDLLEPESDLATAREANLALLEKEYANALNLEEQLLKRILSGNGKDEEALSEYREFCSASPVPFQKCSVSSGEGESGSMEDPFQ